ncbi:MAG: ATP-dependent sacrificial sulfur transferase LarE, partial [Pseudomonadota bacterium]
MEEKFEGLKRTIRDMSSLLVAFSGGVDSTFLLKVAHDELGDRVLALTGVSPTYPDHEFEDAKRLASEIGVRHLIVSTNELNIQDFYQNTSRRCYYCKKELFGICKEKAIEFQLDWVVDGSNYDDREDFRPGMEAAREMGIRSPLLEAELTEDDIRRLSKRLDLPTWNKPSFACLSSRFPYGT